jgi:hypothetical protein
MRLRNLLLAGVGLSAAACDSSHAEREVLITNARDIVLCCDPAALAAGPFEAGSFQIQIYAGQLAHLEEDTVEATFTSAIELADVDPDQRYELEPPVRLSLDSGAPLALGSNTIRVLIDDCFFSSARVRFFAEILGRRKSDLSLAVIALSGSFTVRNTCPPAGSAPTPPQRLFEAILGGPAADFGQFALAMPTGVPTRNSSSTVAPQVPPEPYTETFDVGGVVVELGEQQLEDAFNGPAPRFPLGAGPLGLTLFSDTPAGMSPGPYLVAWQGVEAPIPTAIAGKFLQFALVLDRDQDSSNNYVAQAPFDTDSFDDTDSWYIGQYETFGGWRFSTVDAQTFPPQALPSGARMIFSGQVQMLVIPVAELGSPAAVSARFTTFSHEGDFGLTGGPWSADQSRPIDEPRLEFSLQPRY